MNVCLICAQLCITYILDELDEYIINTMYTRLRVNSVSVNAYYYSYKEAAAEVCKQHEGSK